MFFSFLSTILNLFGTKSQSDMKELAPNVQDVLASEPDVSNLSNDELDFIISKINKFSN